MKEKETSSKNEMAATAKQMIANLQSINGNTPEIDAEIEKAIGGIKLDQVDKLPPNALLSVINVLKTL
jgi:hypothetical protein